jgi:hypothetical protein
LPGSGPKHIVEKTLSFNKEKNEMKEQERVERGKINSGNKRGSRVKRRVRKKCMRKDKMNKKEEQNSMKTEERS